MTHNNKYEQRGASASKSEVHNSLQGLDKGLYEMTFCKILPDISSRSMDHVNILHADTAGTKTSLAYMYWKETGDISVWADIVQDAIVMNVDDMACVGCFDNIIISSTIGRNKHLIPQEVVKELIHGAQKFINNMEDLGIKLHLAGGETADVGDIVRTVDVGITAFGRISKDELIVNNIQTGDVILGLSSTGKCNYENDFNSGIGSNGLTSARHDIFSKEYYDKYPETYAPETDASYIYNGKYKLTDKIVIGNIETSIGKLALSPTRTYIPVLKKMILDFKDQIHGIIHCTGGGQTKVLKFLNKKRVIKDDLFEIPQIFQIIKDSGGYEMEEMFQVFNMGHRMEIYIDQSVASRLMAISEEFNISAKIIGYVENSDENQVIINQQGKSYLYK